MVSAQEWLDREYPQDKRAEIKELVIISSVLTGSLKLENFINLTSLSFESNNLTNLDLSDCPNLTRLSCTGNQLTNLDFLSTITYPDKLTCLFISDNKITGDLAVFSKFINLERLMIGNSDKERIKEGFYNCWTSSLEPLKNLTKLYTLCIESTDIDSGLEYLPDSLNEAKYDTDTEARNSWGRVYCSPKQRPGSKVAAIKEQLKPFGYNLGKWKENYRKRLEREQEGNFTMNQLVLTEK